MKTFSLRKFALTLIMGCAAMATFAQGNVDRQAIKTAIDDWESCRNVVLTRNKGCFAIEGSYNFVAQNIPEDLMKKLEELRENENYIDDVTVTENGLWVILYDTNDAAWSAGIPEGLKQAILEFHENNFYVRSISFNDKGQWAIVSKQRVKTYSAEVTDWLKEVSQERGDLWTVTIGENGILAVFEQWYASRGDIPQNLIDELEEPQFDYYRVKFSDNYWFYATEDGDYKYNFE